MNESGLRAIWVLNALWAVVIRVGTDMHDLGRADLYS